MISYGDLLMSDVDIIMHCVCAGVGYCQGDALFNVTDPNAYIIGDGSVTGEGLVELDNGTAVELSDGGMHTDS